MIVCGTGESNKLIDYIIKNNIKWELKAKVITDKGIPKSYKKRGKR